MPFTVTFGQKPPKFDRDLPTHNVTVKGPRHLFTKQVEKWLFLQGLNRLSSTGAGEVWSTRYNIGAPALYIGAYLERRHQTLDKKGRPQPGAIYADLASRKLMRAATEEFDPADNLDSFVGRGKDQVAAGDRALVVQAGSFDFVANCSVENKARQDLLLGAGWAPIRNPSEKLIATFGTKPFRTRDPLIAANLEYFMTSAARAKLAEKMTAMTANIKISMQQEAPGDFNVPVPEGLDYLDFQKVSIQQILRQKKGALIADDMGLGKTIQAIGILNGTPDAKRVLVICQANMRLKFVKEIDKWKVNNGLSVNHAEGNNFPDTDVVVINYDIAARHIEKIQAVEWDLVFADEAHNMKNEEAQRTQAILGTISKSQDDADFVDMIPLSEKGYIVHMTGTPKPNRVSELWPLLTSSRPDIWGRGPEARQAFLNRYEPPTLIKKPTTRNGRTFDMIIPLPGKPIREQELQMRMRGSGTFMRRMKRDTKGLPKKFRTPIPLPYKLTEDDYDALKQSGAAFEQLKARVGMIGADKIEPGMTEVAAEVINTIKGAPAGSAEFHEIARLRHNLGVLKAPICAQFVLDELMQDKELPLEDQRKTVLFAHHGDVIDILRNAIEEKLPGSVLVYDGSLTTAKKRQQVVDSFQDNKKKRVIIISLAGATGITLTAAHRMRIIEPDWSPSNMAQIEDRIWRIGQEENCDIGYLFMPNSLDELIGNALIRKMETDERALNALNMRGLKGRKEANVDTSGDHFAEEMARLADKADTSRNKPSPVREEVDDRQMYLF